MMTATIIIVKSTFIHSNSYSLNRCLGNSSLPDFNESRCSNEASSVLKRNKNTPLKIMQHLTSVVGCFNQTNYWKKTLSALQKRVRWIPKRTSSSTEVRCCKKVRWQCTIAIYLLPATYCIVFYVYNITHVRNLPLFPLFTY